MENGSQLNCSLYKPYTLPFVCSAEYKQFSVSHKYAMSWWTAQRFAMREQEISHQLGSCHIYHETKMRECDFADALFRVNGPHIGVLGSNALRQEQLQEKALSREHWQVIEYEIVRCILCSPPSCLGGYGGWHFISFCSSFWFSNTECR